MNPSHRFALRPLLAVVTTTCALLATVSHAATMGNDEYSASKARIAATAKADEAACKSMSGNAKDVCEQEAEGKAKVARAELEAAYTGKPADVAKVSEVKAEASYKVAKERCDDLAGNPKDVCEQKAKTAWEKAKADAKLSQKTGKAQTEAMDSKREASLKLEVEKCDALAGDAKSACVANAKSRLGVN
jgi:hypothetical protein